MIILLSDGDANRLANMGSGECQAGVNAAAAAQKAGITVVAIAYGSPTSGTCDTDSGLQACTAMQQMARDANGTGPSSKWFYSDDQGKGACLSGTNTVTDLSGIFGKIGGSVTSGGARLLPLNTT